jgi:hypothetical protein
MLIASVIALSQPALARDRDEPRPRQPRAAAAPPAAPALRQANAQRAVPRLVAEPGPTRSAARPAERGAPRLADRSSAERRRAEVAAPSAGRPAKAQPRKAARQRPRDPDAPVVMRDAPLELLPAPESLDQARLELPASPRAACLAAARRAEQIHGLPAGLLVAVAMSESSLHANAIKIGRNLYYPRTTEQAQEILAKAPHRASPMVGCVQVNARVHAKGADWPLDPLRAADWAGGMLMRWHQETGDWATSLRRWHGGSVRTAAPALCRVRAKLEVVNPNNATLRDINCHDTEVARVRRAGARILEVAEAPPATTLAAQ